MFINSHPLRKQNCIFLAFAFAIRSIVIFKNDEMFFYGSETRM